MHRFESRLTRDEISKWPSEEILSRLNENDVPNAPLLKRTELMDNEQIVASDSIVRTEYEGFGEVRQARPAAQFNKTPSAVRRAGAKAG